MEYKQKPTLIRRIFAYLSAAIVFIVVMEVVLQAIVFVKTGALMPLDANHIACAKFTFFFLLIAGFLIVSLGHFLMTLSHISFRTVKQRHSFAYAIGYLSFVIIGVVCAISANSNLANQMISMWWTYVISAVILFFVALVAGKTFAHIYELKSKLS